MDLGLPGRILISQTVEFTAALQLSDEYFIRIESPFALVSHDKSVALSPEDGAPEAFEPLGELVGQSITECNVGAAGSLTVTFESGARLVVEPDDSYEAWTVTGPGGMMTVCMPGGELAIWGAEATDDK
jgi:hypothetical protein